MCSARLAYLSPTCVLLVPYLYALPTAGDSILLLRIPSFYIHSSSSSSSSSSGPMCLGEEVSKKKNTKPSGLYASSSWSAGLLSRLFQLSTLSERAATIHTTTRRVSVLLRTTFSLLPATNLFESVVYYSTSPSSPSSSQTTKAPSLFYFGLLLGKISEKTTERYGLFDWTL